MKKLKFISILFIIFSFSLFGCGKTENIEENNIEENIENIDVQIEDTIEKTITHEKTEAGQLFDEKIAELNEYYFYYPILDSFTIKGKKAYTEEEINEQFLLNSVLNEFSDKVCLVESFEKISPDEVISYKNGVPSISYNGEFIGYLSLDGTFQEILNEQTTSLYEWFIVQSVADIFCKNLGCEKIQITSGGVPIITMYKEYTLEDFISFSTKIYDNFDIIDKDEASLGRDVEKLKLMGYNITRQNFIDILNENNVNLEDIIPDESENNENLDIENVDDVDNIEIIDNVETMETDFLNDFEDENLTEEISSEIEIIN